MSKNENTGIIIYQAEDGRAKVDVKVENDTVWMTQKSIAELYPKGVNTINEHIKNNKLSKKRLEKNQKDDFDIFIEENKLGIKK